MKIAIIGAGFSGIFAGYLLNKKGINVTIFEKRDYIGGHCKTLSRENEIIELGTLCAFKPHIKELLINLQIEYSERCFYRNYIDENHQYVENVSRKDAALLIDEIDKLDDIMKQYSPSFDSVNYGYIHEDLMLSIHDFLDLHKFKIIQKFIATHLASFGNGHINSVPAFYALKIFTKSTSYSFIKGDKLLFLNNGISELIQKLSQNISDLRYSQEVTMIRKTEEKVVVETNYSSDCFDKVLITTPLPSSVIQDSYYKHIMSQITTNPLFTCIYEINNKNLAPTYYKDNHGKEGKIQFFYVNRQNNKTILTTHAYGTLNVDNVKGTTTDLQKIGVNVKRLISINQWHTVPHLAKENLTKSFYTDLINSNQNSHICFIGSLITKPELSNLYLSISNFVGQLINERNTNM